MVQYLDPAFYILMQAFTCASTSLTWPDSIDNREGLGIGNMHIPYRYMLVTVM